jgi:hypothetical protein
LIRTASPTTPSAGFDSRGCTSRSIRLGEEALQPHGTWCTNHITAPNRPRITPDFEDRAQRRKLAVVSVQLVRSTVGDDLGISAPPDPDAADECQLHGQEDEPEEQ